MAAAAALALAACGGGGGGLAVHPDSLQFRANIRGDAPPSQVVEVPITSPEAASVAVGFPIGAPTPGWIGLDLDTSQNPVRVIVSMTNTSLSVGSYHASVRIVVARADDSVIAWTDVPVSYTIDPALVSDPLFASVQQVYGAPPVTTQLRVLDPMNRSYAWTAETIYDEQGWLRIDGGTTSGGSRLPGALTVSAVEGLPPGNYFANVRLTGGGASTLVEVTANVVAPFLTFPPDNSVSFTLAAGTKPADLQKTLATLSDGAAGTFTVHSTEPWLQVSPTQGTSGDALTVRLDPAHLEGIARGARSASVVLDFAVPSLPVVQTGFLVAVDVRLPTVASVQPSIVAPGSTETLTVRGTGFTGLKAGQLRFGDTPATSIQVVSDTELRAVPPALAAGVYPIRIPNAAGLELTGAHLTEQLPEQYAAQVLAYPEDEPHWVEGMAYDPERKALLVGYGYGYGVTGGKVIRFPYEQGGWGAPASQEVFGISQLALAPDGSVALARMSSGMVRLDPVTLAAMPDVYIPGSSLTQFAFAQPTRAVVMVGLDGYRTQPFWYSAADGTYTAAVDAQFSVLNVAAASGDGSRILIGNTGLTPAQQVYRMDPSTGAMTPLQVWADVRGMMLDLHGTRILVGRTLYDGDFGLIGTVPSDMWAATLSPRGDRVYALDSSRRLRTFDASAGVGLPELGSPITLPGSASGFDMIVVSPDGGTLFMAGWDSILVQPAPP
jgi:hypothetical protein